MAITRPCARCGTRRERGQPCPTCDSSEHARKARAYAQLRPELAAIRRSAAWRRASAATLERDEGCVLGPSGCAGQLEAHHRVSLRDGGDPVDLANLVTLCSRHHRLVESGRLRLKQPGHR